MSVITYTEVRTDYGIANIWEARAGQWSWTLNGSEGCGCASFADALGEAESAQVKEVSL